MPQETHNIPQKKINMYVIHQLGGPYWEKLCPRS